MQTNKPVPNQNPQTSDFQPANVLPTTETLDLQQPTANKKTPKWLVVGLIILLLGATSVFAYKYYKVKQRLDNQKLTTTPPVEVKITDPPPSTPTEKWETYKNKEYGFEFKYPSDWSFFLENKRFTRFTIEKEDKTQPQLSSELKRVSGKANYPVYKISIFIEDNPQNYSVEEYLFNKYKMTLEEIAFPEDSLEQITVSGIKGVKYRGRGDPISPIIADLTYNYRYYSFSYGALTGNKETEDKFLPIFKQLLSNFKFID